MARNNWLGTETSAAKTTANSANGSGKGPIKRDVFGFRVDGKCHQLGKMLLRRSGCDMTQVREAAWNDLHLPFHTVFNRLVAKGLAEKAKDGRMIASAKVRRPAAGTVQVGVKP